MRIKRLPCTTAPARHGRSAPYRALLWCKGRPCKQVRLVLGFTLIELLIVISIMSTLLFVGYAGYRGFARRQVLNNTYNELEENLNLYRQQALSGEKPSNCTGTFIGYTIQFTANSYQAAVDCTIGDQLLQAVSLPVGITLSFDTSTTTFLALGKGTSPSSDNTLTLQQSSTTKRLKITKEGTIERLD